MFHKSSGLLERKREIPTQWHMISRGCADVHIESSGVVGLRPSCFYTNIVCLSLYFELKVVFEPLLSQSHLRRPTTFIHGFWKQKGKSHGAGNHDPLSKDTSEIRASGTKTGTYGNPPRGSKYAYHCWAFPAQTPILYKDCCCLIINCSRSCSIHTRSPERW